jgi:transketolase
MLAEKEKYLQILACKIRLGILEGVFNAKCGHPGGSLSVADLLAYLYFEQLHIDPQNPKWENRDRFVLSKGHVAPALYAALALRGFFPTEDLKTLRKNGSYLQGHPSMKLCPGVDMSTGSLGQGISAACGMALGAKLTQQDICVYALLGDGEIEEGQVWEAAMFAGNKGLDRLIAIVDNNGLQIDGSLEEVNSPCPIPEKFAAFKWNVIEINAHDFNQIEAAFAQSQQFNGKPTMIVAKSVKGKGISYMENQIAWHGAAPNAEQYASGKAELEAELARLTIECAAN